MNADDGCMREDVVCGSNDVGGPKCGNNGFCVGSFLQNEYRCNCKPGYRGHQCETCKNYYNFCMTVLSSQFEKAWGKSVT